VLGPPHSLGRSIQQLLDKVERLLSILVDILLVRVGVVAVAAVGIGRVAVGLEDGFGSGFTLEAAGASRELFHISVSPLSFPLFLSLSLWMHILWQWE